MNISTNYNLSFFRTFNSPKVSNPIVNDNFIINENFKPKKREKGNSYEKNLVLKIIENDSKKGEVNAERMASKITAAAEFAGVKASEIACIVMNETHFSEKIKNVSTGKGPMGLTSIAIKDLYERAKNDDDKLKSLIDKYKTLDKVFAQKRKNPKLDLGKLGEILYKYKNSSSLYSAIQRDFDLNLKVGAFIYKTHLKQSKGNLRKAFESYNRSADKKAYAQRALNALNKAKSGAKKGSTKGTRLDKKA